MKKSNLPISPHLQIYKPQMTSILSIAHRITGFCLNFLLILVSLWILSLALGEESYKIFTQLFESIIIKIFLSIGFFGFFYHALNGVRHIFWDFGFFVDNFSSSIFGVFIIILTTILSFLVILSLGIF